MTYQRSSSRVGMSAQPRRTSQGQRELTMRSALNGIKVSSHLFETCPACHGKGCVRERSLDVYCSACGWDSSAAFVDAGGMDDLIYAFEMHEARTSALRKREKTKIPVTTIKGLAV